jgi:hypothetical protein
MNIAMIPLPHATGTSQYMYQTLSIGLDPEIDVPRSGID